MNIASNISAYAKRIHYASTRSVPHRFLHKNVPYFCQWESSELAKDILAKKISTNDDPNWQSSGAVNRQEYNDWSWAGCGMACTKMLLAHKTNKVVPLVSLGKQCASYGGYTMPLKESVGLIYKPYITFVNKEFGWNAHIMQHMPLQGVMYELGKGNFIIASVSSGIRQPEQKPRRKGGHLVLLLGYDRKKKEVYFHNPSGTNKKTQAYATVSFNEFKKFFSGRGIVVK